jgi:Tol biopolymer transport system component
MYNDFRGIMKKLHYIILVCLVLPSCTVFTPEPTATPIPTATKTPIPTSTPTVSPTPLGSSSGKILHMTKKTNEEDEVDIFITSLDTLEKVQLTDSILGVKYMHPIASHSGDKIAYVKSRKTFDVAYGELFWKYEIFLMGIDRGYFEKISNIQKWVGRYYISDWLQEGMPSWSPDDSMLAFSSNRHLLLQRITSYEAEIFVIDLETYEIQQLTKARGYSMHPSWSPNGQQITFMSDRDGDWDIYYMESDGSGLDIKITNNTSADRNPSWSNDGNKIIYHSDRDGNYNLYVYYFDTQEEKQLTSYRTNEIGAKWSPDDSWIVFSSDKDGDYEIFIMNIESKEEIKITDNQVKGGFASWIP